MKVKLLQDARIRHSAGEVIDASPAEAAFLISTNSAVPMMAAPTMKQTPEDGIPETEERKETAKKPVRKTAAKK